MSTSMSPLWHKWSYQVFMGEGWGLWFWSCSPSQRNRGLWLLSCSPSKRNLGLWLLSCSPSKGNLEVMIFKLLTFYEESSPPKKKLTSPGLLDITCISSQTKSDLGDNFSVFSGSTIKKKIPTTSSPRGIMWRQRSAITWLGCLCVSPLCMMGCLCVHQLFPFSTSEVVKYFFWEEPGGYDF